MKQVNLSLAVAPLSEERALSIISNAKVKPGSYVRATWRSAVQMGKKTAAKFAANGVVGVWKISTSIVRLGISYQKIEGAPSDPGSLPGGKKWIKYPYISQSEKTGQKYLRMSTARNTKIIPAVGYVLVTNSGKVLEVTKAWLIEMGVPASYFQSKINPTGVFDIKLENLLSLK